MKNAKSQAVACSHDSINHHDVVLDLNSSKACGAPISNLSQESCSSNSKNTLMFISYRILCEVFALVFARETLSPD
ncbi:hypothetical protein Lal_00029697 [Lupinus albus]|nr:hypothetical protein Lal_00029697 [Lupinus albus]